MHSYAFLKARYACRFGLRAAVLLAVFMLAMTLTPMLVRFSEKAGHEHFARFTAYAGYTWMAVLFLFVSVSLCIDFLRLCLYTAEHIFKIDLSLAVYANRYFFIISLVCSLSIVAYGYYEAGQIKAEQLVIKTSKIPKETGRLKIVQISDVHLGLIVRNEKLGRIIAEIRKTNPDILVSTGDLLDGQIDQPEGFTEALKEIQPPYGKFAIMGNHEFYAGVESSIDFMEKAGFRVLRGKSIAINGAVNIAGVDDISSRPYNYVEIDEKALLSGLPRNMYTLLLKHRPAVDPAAIGLFDLQLSGHTHMGQIFPFRYVVKLFFPRYSGFYKLSDTSYLYVSRGSGTWGPPIRFLAQPEITVIELVHQSNE